MFVDPLGWRVHGSSWPFVWLARKFRVGSRPNMWAYAVSDWIVNRRVERWMRKFSA